MENNIILESNLVDLLIKAKSKNNLDIINVIHYIYKDKFVCINGKIWYCFNDIRWIMCNTGVLLQLN